MKIKTLQIKSKETSVQFQRENFLGDSFCELERIEPGLDDKMPIGETVKFLTLFEKLFGAAFIFGERARPFGKSNVSPAMFERRFEPNNGAARRFYHPP